MSRVSLHSDIKAHSSVRAVVQTNQTSNSNNLRPSGDCATCFRWQRTRRREQGMQTADGGQDAVFPERRQLAPERLHKCAPAQHADRIQSKPLDDPYVRPILASGCTDMTDGLQWSGNGLTKRPSEVNWEISAQGECSPIELRNIYLEPADKDYRKGSKW